jgi:hypothetical protein
MKILYEKDLPNGKVECKLCLCKGPVSTCKPQDRPVRTFENKGKLGAFKKAFHLKN